MTLRAYRWWCLILGFVPPVLLEFLRHSTHVSPRGLLLVLLVASPYVLLVAASLWLRSLPVLLLPFLLVLTVQACVYVQVLGSTSSTAILGIYLAPYYQLPTLIIGLGLGALLRSRWHSEMG